MHATFESDGLAASISCLASSTCDAQARPPPPKAARHTQAPCPCSRCVRRAHVVHSLAHSSVGLTPHGRALQADWALLPADIWRQIIHAACGAGPAPQALSNPCSAITPARWEWWRLIARVSSTCKSLREALLGPEAASLWSWVYLKPPPPVYPRDRHLQTLLRQAHLATSALVLGSSGWQASQLRAAMPRLSSVQDLTLLDFRRADMIALLPLSQTGQPCTLALRSSVPLPGSHSWLQQLELDLYCLSEPQLCQLTAWLPELQDLRLHFSGSLPKSIDHLQQLCFLPLQLEPADSSSQICFIAPRTERLGTPVKLQCEQRLISDHKTSDFKTPRQHVVLHFHAGHSPATPSFP